MIVKGRKEMSTWESFKPEEPEIEIAAARCHAGGDFVWGLFQTISHVVLCVCNRLGRL